MGDAVQVVLAMATPMLRVELSAEEDLTLQELRAASGVPQRTKDRAEALRLSHREWTPAQIGEYLGWRVATVRRAIHRWRQDGLYGLWDSPRSGRRARCSVAVIGAMEEYIAAEKRTVNSAQLAEHLAQVHGVYLSGGHLRRLLKKKISVETHPSQSSPPPGPSAASPEAR
ncbi:MAG: helix-turn-helix domain-containing protein [Elainellaceae cyanobacterium]